MNKVGKKTNGYGDPDHKKQAESTTYQFSNCQQHSEDTQTQAGCASNIEWSACLAGHWPQQWRTDQERDQADTSKDEEDGPPAGGIDERATGNQSQGGSAGHRELEPADCGSPSLSTIGVHHQRHRVRIDHRCEQAEEDPKEDQRRSVPGQATQERGNRSAKKADEQHLAVPMYIAQSSGHRSCDSHDQHEPSDRPCHGHS